jgi:hypothetical protein
VATLDPNSVPPSDDAARMDILDGPGDRTARRLRSGAWRPSLSPPRARGACALSAATVGALLGVLLVTGEAAAPATARELTESAAVADALGIDGSGVDQIAIEDPELLGQLAASRSQREAEQVAAADAQAQAEQAAVAAKAEAEARAAAEAAAAAQAAEAAAAAQESAASVAVSIIAKISNSAGPVRPQAQAAANAVVSNVPGADSITIGGTRSSAADPGGHPSGLALDYMVMSDSALGDAIVEYHIAHWDSLGVDYIIWQQRRLASPGGSWRGMENRGSATANHMDHPHVNYRG